MSSKYIQLFIVNLFSKLEINQHQNLCYPRKSKFTNSFFTISLLVISFSLQAQDDEAPVIITPAMSMQRQCGESGLNTILSNWYNANGGAQATDNSGTVTYYGVPTLSEALAIFQNSSDTLCGYTQSVLVYFYAQDPSGNLSVPMPATFSTVDMVDPMIVTQPTNQVIECKPGARDSMIAWIKSHGDAVALDQCSQTVTWTNFLYSNPDNPAMSGFGSIATGPYPLIPQNACNFVLKFNFYVLDECGNDAITSVRTYTIRDTKSPVLSSTPQDITVNCNQIPPPPGINAMDECAGLRPVTLNESSTQSSDSMSCAAYNFVITRTWTSSDPCNNVVSHTQKITVRDIAPPTISFANPKQISCEKTGPAFVNEAIISYGDLCSPSTFSYVDLPSSPSCEYTFVRNYTVTDVCGNSATASHTINVVDHTPPAITTPASNKGFDCNSTNDLQQEFNIWLLSKGGATAVDLCSSLHSFAAIPGSYELSDTTTFPGVYPSQFINGGCLSGIHGFSSAQLVDFVFYDGCGNASKTTAAFGITDTLAPQISNCPNTITKTLGPNSCDVNITIDVPAAFDNCAQSTSPIVKFSSQAVTYVSGTSYEVLVDTVTLQFGPYNTNGFTPTSNAVLTLDLLKLDADDPDEFFYIYDENNVLLGQTIHTSGQCQDTTQTISNISLTTLQQWLSDGYITFKLIPNIGPFPISSINAFCSGARVNGKFIFDIDEQNLIKTYSSINNKDTIEVSNLSSIEAVLNGGVNRVDFIYQDCAENQNKCTIMINVVDTIAPHVVCPKDTTVVIDVNSCTAKIHLPLDLNVSDNCDFPDDLEFNAPNTEDSKLINFSYIEPLDQHLATNKIITFSGLTKIYYVEDPAVIEVEVFGDLNGPGETFTIVGEGGQILGSTEIVPSNECVYSKSSFEIPMNLYNQWVADGNLNITAIASNQVSSEGSGINPCIALDPNEAIDGISKISAKIKINKGSFKYNVSGPTTLPEVELGNLDTLDLTLKVGANKLTFQVSDAQGNTSSCTTTIVVSDTIAPIAKCKNTIINIHPSGLIPYELKLEDTDAGSTDNCGITSIQFNPNFFDCNSIGSQVSITMTVTDINGNHTSCESLVKIEKTSLTPTYTSGLCEGDTLKFFANVPPSPQQNTYTFKWYRNGVFFSDIENPVIPNANDLYNDSYRLVVSGFNGCEAEGTMLVNVQPLSTPSLTSDKNSYCNGEQVVLTTTNFAGNINYSWYEGTYPNGILIQNSTTSSIVLTPSSQTHRYYVIAQSDVCTSNPSAVRKIDVFQTPNVSVNEPFITICEGQNLILGTSVTGTNYQYFWSGPVDYNSTLQNPPAITNISIDQQGLYTLVIKIGECESDTASSNVVVFKQPAKPIITGETIYCEGSTFSLVVNNLGPQDKYRWFKNNEPYTITQGNTLEILSAPLSLTGEWTVVAESNGCQSVPSEKKEITIDNLSEIGASNNGPVCIGDSVILNATTVPNATYIWSGPGIGTLTGQVIKVPASAGDYSVTITTTTNCINSTSTTVEVVSPPQITALSNDSYPCMDGKTTITFFPSVFPQGNYTYKWKGPNNYTSSLKNPSIQNATPNDNGTYSLVILDRGCPSMESSNEINIQLVPSPPNIQGISKYCEGDTILLHSSVSADNYFWLGPLGTINSNSDTIIIPQSTNQNDGFYKLKITNGNCDSEFSDSLLVNVIKNPETPQIIGDPILCYGDTLKLSSLGSLADQYDWSSPNGITYVNKEIIIPNATQLQSGEYSLKIKVGQCFSKLSQPFTVDVLPEVTTASFTETTINACTDFTSPISICLTNESAVPNAQYFLYNANNGVLLAQSNTLCFQINTTEGLIEGLNLLYVITDKDGCHSKNSPNLVFNLMQAPNIHAQAETDFFILCDENDLVNLKAIVGLNNIDVLWQSKDPVNIFNPQSAETTAQDFALGLNLVTLTYSSVGCKNFSKDTVQVYLETQPTSIDDNFKIEYGKAQIIDIIENDDLPINYSLKLLNTPQHGKLNIDGTTITYSPNLAYAGQDQFEYEVCVESCENLCSSAVVKLSVAEDIDCILPTIITPNNDGINDEFIIPCLYTEKYAENRLIVFNEWGDEVFQASPYKNDWQGTFGGKALPVGTYFYVFKRDNQDEGSKGFLIIQK